MEYSLLLIACLRGAGIQATLAPLSLREHTYVIATLDGKHYGIDLLKKTIKRTQHDRLSDRDALFLYHPYRGNMLVGLKHFRSALAVYRTVLQHFQGDTHSGEHPTQISHLDICPSRQVVTENTLAAVRLLITYQKTIAANTHDATNLCPGASLAWYTLGDTLAKHQAYREALPCLEKALDINSHQPLLWWRAGTVCKGLGKKQEALSYFYMGTAQPTHFGLNHFWISGNLLEQGEFRAAGKALLAGIYHFIMALLP